MKLIMPYSYGSNSAKLLKQETGIKFLNKRTTRKLPSNLTVINWGCSEYPNRELNSAVFLNKPESVYKASNKLSTLISLRDSGIVPDFTENASEARIMAQRGIVIARTLLRANSGRGIQIIPKGSEDIPEAPLYVKYIKKKKEFRVHVFKGEILFVQEKKRRNDIPDEEVNWQIRNHSNGFIFAHNDVEIGDEGLNNAIIACNTLGLDFGAVDVIWNERENKYYVLEVNTAPGITGETLRIYSEKFTNLST